MNKWDKGHVPSHSMIDSFLYNVYFPFYVKNPICMVFEQNISKLICINIRVVVNALQNRELISWLYPTYYETNM